VLLATHATTLAAAALIALALFAYEASRDLPGMRGFAFGPGTARAGSPTSRSARRRGLRDRVAHQGPGIDRFHIRGPLFITLSLCYLLGWSDHSASSSRVFLSILAAAGATPERASLRRWFGGGADGLLRLAVSLCLNLPMQIWPNNWDLATILKGLSSIR